MGKNEIEKREKGEVTVSEDFLKPLTEKQRRALLKLVALEEMPKTQLELSRALGITERSLFNWWRDPNWCQAVHSLMKETRIKYLPLIERSLIREAVAGSIAHQKGYYRLLGEPLDAENKISVQVVNNQANIAFVQEHRDKIKAIADQLADSINTPTEVIDGQIEAEGGNKK
jgi:hypothetical protein